ncbi:MAG: NAD-dependent malic enzyme [Armatimonadetes bacterium]|nr:NAD-dependent malic enzyme [Armatimonadota bacterium]
MQFQIERGRNGRRDIVKTGLGGFHLLETPVYNKGTAFPEDERSTFGLDGLLPPHVTDIGEQLERTYHEFSFKPSAMEKHIYLRSLQDRNEVLFYRLLLTHLEEMMPLVYTPCVGDACRHFSHIYRRPRGLFVPFPERDDIDAILANRAFEDVDVVVVTDGERILGLGDQGAGGMGIPIGKLSLYTLCGGIHPARTLPVLLDAGTDNPLSLNDPHYLGWRHTRIRGEEYFDFVDRFVQSVKRTLPGVLLQFEDFSRDNASLLLDRYRNELCTFNDDIQGTAAVTVSAMLAAMRQTGTSLADQRVVLYGAGSAAVGIAGQLADELVATGTPESEAVRRFWLLNSKGLVHDGSGGVLPFQRRFARDAASLHGWTASEDGCYKLDEVVRRVRPTALIGVSGQPGSFTEEIVREMARHVDRPVVFPLSNPTSKAEATPEDLVSWTEGRVIVATGSPFPPVPYEGRTIGVSQCNNSYVFPGVGLGVVAVKAKRVTQSMFMAASAELAAFAKECPGGPVLPPLTAIRDVSRRIAAAVGRAAIAAGVADALEDAELASRIDEAMWHPEYPDLEPLGASADRSLAEPVVR